MEGRRGAGLMTQRRLEVEPPPAAPAVPPSPAPPPTPSAAQGPVRPADRPVPPSNEGLLERQLRWQRERGRFEAVHPREGAST